MNRKLSINVAGPLLLVLTLLLLGGCAAGSQSALPVDLEKKVETARSPADHEEIAAIYERQAKAAAAASERHRGLARAYERGYVAFTPAVGSRLTVENENKNLTAHCDNLARIYEQAAVENLAMAKEHRQLAAAIKD